jgi:predicted lipoprotein with Yx(FWY)xxD motif
MRRTPSIGLMIGLVAVLAACGPAASASPSAVTSAAPETPSGSASATPEASPTESPSPAESAATSGDVTVDVATSDLGEILVDGEGRTLYAFTADADGESTCYDDCATAWPALTVDGEISVGGDLDDSAFSTVARTDGSMQVKIGDWPLYYFANDAAPGDVNGQGVADKWYVVSPTGELVQG